VRTAPGPETLVYLPLVGLILGALAGGAGQLAARLVPQALVAALIFALSLGLTGALHADGFLDTADALFASVDVQRRLEILKDPAHGSFAVAAFVAVAAFWLAALGTLPPSSLLLACALAAGGARFGAALNALLVPYGRDDVAPAFERRPSRAGLALVGLVVVAVAQLLAPWAWIVVAIDALGGLLLGRYVKRRFGGGLVGDHYGFIIVVLEVAGLVTAALGLAHQTVR
jgi:adenosylcobinamide-GDP ribazoletransferase